MANAGVAPAKLCSNCQKRPPVFVTKKGPARKGDKRHDMCRQCWKSGIDSEREFNRAQNTMTSTVNFEPQGHVYTVAGVRKPSVTHILKSEKFADFSNVPESNAGYSMDLGTKIHLACQLYDEEALDGETLDQEITPYLAGYSGYVTDTKFGVELIEHRFYNAAHGFCGTLDRTGTFPPNDYFPAGSKAVLDIKKSDGSIRDWVGVQLAAYAMSLKAPLTYRRIALRLSSDGKYHHREFPASTFGRDWNGFLSALGSYNWKAGAK